jgi:cell division protein FtsB
MALGTRARRRITQILGPVFAAAVVAYFAYYTVEGERGLRALTRLRAQVAQADLAYQSVKGEREAMEFKVTSLRPDSLDVDRLDERTRALLNDSQHDELIILLPNSTSAGH